MKKNCKKILIVSANPETTASLRLADEMRGITEGCRKAKERDAFDIKILQSTRLDDFRLEMLEFKPNILHFCGHGSGDKGIILESDNSGAQFLEGKRLANFLGNFTSHLECVILNACFSEKQAEDIRNQVDFVVGMKEAIGDKIASRFSVLFFEAVFAQRDYQASFDYAIDSLDLEEITGSLSPVLMTRGVAVPDTTPEQHRERIELYLTSLKRGCEIKLQEINSSVYPLEGNVFTKEAMQHHYGAEDMDLRVAYQSFDETGEKKERDDDICKCINGITKKVVLLGEPGCGKSVSLLKLTIEFTERALADENELIPILIPLGSYKDPIAPSEYVKKRMAKDTDFVDELFDPRCCLFIFDALNEVASDKRDDVAKYIIGLNRYIISCRLLDYKKEFSKQTDIARVEILDLDLLKIKEAINHRTARGSRSRGDLWTAIGGNNALITFWDNLRKDGHEDWFWKSPITVKSSDFSAMKSDSQTHEFEAWLEMHNNGLMPLCRNPMLLRMVYDLYLKNGTNLPENRGKLFEQFANECLESELRKIALKEDITASQQSALKKHTMEALTCVAEAIIANKQGTGIRYQEGKTALLSKLSEAEIAEVEKFARDANILIADDDEYRFIHQLHQEYFASRSLHHAFKQNSPARKFFNAFEWWEAEGWEESAVILAGILSREELNAFFIWLADTQPKLVIRCIENVGISGLTTKTLEDSTKTTLLKKWMTRLENESEGVKSRIFIGQSLDKLGDPRKGVGVIRVGKSEQPEVQWINFCSNFLSVSKYPITVSQYAAFIDARDGYINDHNWEGSIESIDWHNSRKTKPSLPELSNAPIVNVSWYDAQAFCKWLSRKCNETIRLPSESEWVKYVNSPESIASFVTENDLGEMDDAEKMASVGLFAKSINDDHVVDMGLVWEWCNDIYGQKPPELGVSNPLSLPTCVLKGGSWRYPSEYKTSDYCFRTYASHVGIDVGFRIVKKVRS